jgi:hypothetical protein
MCTTLLAFPNLHPPQITATFPPQQRANVSNPTSHPQFLQGLVPCSACSICDPAVGIPAAGSSGCPAILQFQFSVCSPATEEEGASSPVTTSLPGRGRWVRRRHGGQRSCLSAQPLNTNKLHGVSTWNGQRTWMFLICSTSAQPGSGKLMLPLCMRVLLNTNLLFVKHNLSPQSSAPFSGACSALHSTETSSGPVGNHWSKPNPHTLFHMLNLFALLSSSVEISIKVIWAKVVVGLPYHVETQGARARAGIPHQLTGKSWKGRLSRNGKGSANMLQSAELHEQRAC